MRAEELGTSRELQLLVKKLTTKLNKGKDKDSKVKEKRANVEEEKEPYTNTILEYHQWIDAHDGALEDVVSVDEWAVDESGWQGEEDSFASDGGGEADEERYHAEFDVYSRTIMEAGKPRCRACFRANPGLRAHPLAEEMKLPEEACFCQDCHDRYTSDEVTWDRKNPKFVPRCLFCGYGELEVFACCKCDKSCCEVCRSLTRIDDFT
jgi:ubiquitin